MPNSHLDMDRTTMAVLGVVIILMIVAVMFIGKIMELLGTLLLSHA